MLKKTKVFLFVVLCSFFVYTPAIADVWTVKNSWNNQWEEYYSTWIEQEFDPNLLDPIQLKVDCADLCYVVRAIFAHSNHLPFIASDVNGVQMGHYDDRWNNLKTSAHWTQDQRFKAFLTEVVRFVSTKSFAHDTYPVAINEQTVRPGLVIYENIIANHACFVGRVNRDNIIPVEFFESTVPARVQFRKTTTLNIHIYDPDVPHDHSGTVQWNWPVKENNRWVYIPDEQMPFYSLDIYQPTFEYRSRLSKPLNRAVNQHLYLNENGRQKALQNLVDLFDEQIRFRNDLIQEANNKLETLGRNYRDEDFEYNYGTNSRDQRMNELMGQIWTALEEYDLPRFQFFKALNQVPVTISKDHRPVTLYHLFITTHQNWIKSNAYAPPGERWGLKWDALNQRWLFNGIYPFSKVTQWYQTAEDRSEVFKNYIEDTKGTISNNANL